MNQVATPFEVAIGAVTGGGLLFWISKSLTEAISGSANSQLTFKSPIKIIVSDLTKIFLKKDKDKASHPPHISSHPNS